MTDPAFSLRGVGYRIGSARILDGVDCEVPARQWTGILGPNGAGKSTLLRMLAGVLPPSAGEVAFRGKALASRSARERARHVAFLPQRTVLTFPFQVREVVGMGRTPHLERWQTEGEADARVVARAMQLTEVADLAGRNVLTLSGGEFQRVMLARALAQEPDVLLLDEPTTNLDMRHAFEMVEVLTSLVQAGVTVVSVLHDVNLAASACASVVLLRAGRVHAAGATRDVLTADAIRAVYAVDVAVGEHPQTGAPQFMPFRPMPPT